MNVSLFIFVCVLVSAAATSPAPSPAPTTLALTDIPSAIPTAATSTDIPSPAPVTATPTVPDCEPDWYSYQKICYHLSNSVKMDRAECYESCQNFDGIYSNKKASMLCITNSGVNVFVGQLAGAYAKYWIGYIQSGLSNSWRWSTGDSSCYSLYSRWGIGEPSDIIGSDDCATAYSSSASSTNIFWDDEACSDDYVCGCQMPSNDAAGAAKLMMGLLLVPAAVMLSFCC